MCSNDLHLTLNGDTFASMKKDFDTILHRTIGNMEMKGADEAVITLKLSISLDKTSINSRDVTKPSFKHDINSVMQVKDKMTGQMKDEVALVWDEDEGAYVLRKINDGQMNLFEDGDVIDVDFEHVPDNEQPAIGEGQLGLPESTEGEDEVEYSDDDEDAAEEVSEVSDDLPDPVFAFPVDPESPIGWLSQFIGHSMRVTEAMGNYTVRTYENKVVLSSAAGKESTFYCPAEKLAPHAGHELICVVYGDKYITNISIECEECNEVIFDLDVPAYDTDDEDEADYDDEE